MRTFIPSFLLLTLSAQGAFVEIDYRIIPGDFEGETIIIPNPDEEAPDFEVTPSFSIESGTMTVLFSADDTGQILNGPVIVSSLTFQAETNIRANTGQQLLGQDLFVDLAGPLSGSQQTRSSGALEALSSYIELTNGNFDTLLGPTACSGNFFNAGCAGLTLLTGVEFPLEEIPGEDVPLALVNGGFAEVNTPGGSQASNAVFIPLGGLEDLTVPVPIAFLWEEEQRRFTLVPEPGVSTLSLVSLLGACFRRRRMAV